ncbi:MAG: hypothetical protein GKR90_22370 [Pseudomonadales bacterium]|nr:hypothetical protein [Pseudomonadales bacterium]
MTEYELADLFISLSAEAGRSTMDFVTVLFAYLVLAHFVGATLDRIYIVIVTLIYTMFAIWPILGTYQAGSMMFEITQAHPQISHSLGLAVDFNPGYVPFVVLGSAWALSLAYMYRIRRSVL